MFLPEPTCQHIMHCPVTTRAGPVDGDSELQLVTVNSDVGVQVGSSQAASSPDASQSEIVHLVAYPGDYGACGASMQVMGQADIWRRLFSFTMHMVEARWWIYCTHALVAPSSFARCLATMDFPGRATCPITTGIYHEVGGF